MVLFKIVSDPYEASHRLLDWTPTFSFKSKHREVEYNGAKYKIIAKKEKVAPVITRVRWIFLSILTLGILPFYDSRVKSICIKGKETVRFAIQLSSPSTLTFPDEWILDTQQQSFPKFHFLQGIFAKIWPNDALKQISQKSKDEIVQSFKVMNFIKFYFLSPYKEASLYPSRTKTIKGVEYVVHRFNHGLAHGLRQGALAKDFVELLVKMKEKYGALDHPALDRLGNWVCSKLASDQNFLYKIEMAASFQRSGRQSEISSSDDMEKYKKFERDDALYFQHAANVSDLFQSEEEIKVFQESILWSNKGELDEELYPDLKYLRCILHASHSFDLRRIKSFNPVRICHDAIKQLLGIDQPFVETVQCRQIQEQIWEKSKEYLEATGDRDLILKRDLSDEFFLQTADPQRMIGAIHQVRRRQLAI